MKILVTGGAGYIGSHMVWFLKEKGLTPVIVDNFSTGYRASIPAGVECLEGDLRDEKFVAQIFKQRQFEAIFHFAAAILVGDSVSDPLFYYQNNVTGSLNLISAAHKHNVKNIIFSSTAAVYGNAGDHAVTERSPLNPMSPYGKSKLMTEEHLRDLSFAHPEFRSVTLRYFNVSGARTDGALGSYNLNDTHLIKLCAEACAGARSQVQIFGSDFPTPDGTCIRDYIHIEDLVMAHWQALEFLQVGGSTEVFNLGYGHGLSVKEVIQEFKHLVPSLNVVEGPRRPGDPAQIVANTDKARRILKWIPRHDSLTEMCQTALQWEYKLRGRK